MGNELNVRSLHLSGRDGSGLSHGSRGDKARAGGERGGPDAISARVCSCDGSCLFIDGSMAQDRSGVKMIARLRCFE